MPLSILSENKIDQRTLRLASLVEAADGIRLVRNILGDVAQDLHARLVAERDSDTIRQIQGAIQAIDDMDAVLANPKELIR